MTRASRMAAPYRSADCSRWRGRPSVRPITSCQRTASYAEIAMRRGGKAPTDVTVVRTGPDRGAAAAEGRGARHCGEVGSTSSRTSASWGRKMASILPSGPRHTWSMTLVGRTSRSLSWAQATVTTTSWRSVTNSAYRITWSCRAGFQTRRSSTYSPPPRSDFLQTRRTRSTTSRQ